MKKILCLDIGDNWVGTALSDDLLLTAQPFETINRENLETFLKNLAKEKKVKEVIVGYPKTMSGKISQQTQKIIDLHKKLEEKFTEFKFILWDERLSSKRADQLRSKKAKAKDKQHTHSVAAAFILDSYLEYLRFQKELQKARENI